MYVPLHQWHDINGNGFLNGGLQGNKNNGGSANQSNAHEGNGALNGGAQGNANSGENASQSNNHQGNGVANGGAKDNESNAKNTNQLPNTGNSNETTNGTLIGSILAALGALFLGIRKKSE